MGKTIHLISFYRQLLNTSKMKKFAVKHIYVWYIDVWNTEMIYNKNITISYEVYIWKMCY